MANPHRAEINVQIGKETKKLRLTHEALVEIETEIGQGITALTKDLTLLRARYTDMVTVLYHGMRQAGEDDRRLREMIQDAIIEQGMEYFSGVLIDFTEMAFLGVKEYRGKARREPGTEDTQASDTP